MNRLFRDFLGEVERRDAQFQPVVEAVGRKPESTRIEVKFLAVLFAGMDFHPLHQGFGETFAAMAFEADQVVDIERLASGQPFGDAEA